MRRALFEMVVFWFVGCEHVDSSSYLDDCTDGKRINRFAASVCSHCHCLRSSIPLFHAFHLAVDSVNTRVVYSFIVNYLHDTRYK